MKRDVTGNLLCPRILLPCSTREMWWEAGRTWCHGAHMCHAFGWGSRWLSSDMAEIAFLSKFGSRGGRLFILASASCQLSRQNRWPCLWSCVLKICSSDAENRRERPPDLTFPFVYVHDLSHPYIVPPMQSLLEPTFSFIFAFRGDCLTTSPFIISPW